MKNFFVFSFFLISGFVFSQQFKDKVIYFSCGLCQFDRSDLTDCTLTAKIKGKVYVVEGTGIDDHGDAHAKDGFCMAVRKAKITGDIKNAKLYVTKFELLPIENKKTSKK